MDATKIRYGQCRYCGENRIVEPLDPESDQEDIDMTATASCDCPGAKAARDEADQMERVKRHAKAIAQQVWADDPDAADVLEKIINGSAWAVWAEGVGKVTISAKPDHIIKISRTSSKIKIKTSWRYENEAEF